MTNEEQHILIGHLVMQRRDLRCKCALLLAQISDLSRYVSELSIVLEMFDDEDDSVEKRCGEARSAIEKLEEHGALIALERHVGDFQDSRHELESVSKTLSAIGVD